jgi:membrane AbrB-like protein
MLVAAVIAATAPQLVRPAPGLVQTIAFGVIGLYVGLRFDRQQVKLAARMAPAILGMIGFLMVSCAVLAIGMAAWTGRPYFDCYLATTPGGLAAVLAVAVQSGSDAAFVSAIQVLRLFAALLVAPVLGRLLSWTRVDRAGPPG